MSSVPLLPAELPDISLARLPGVYETARKALTECSRIDECKDWSDKAAALASYALQARDDSLRVMAVRIQLRAERRCGELLKQIPAASGARTDLGSVVTRGSAAEEAGLSERRKKNALRLASVPEKDFDRQVTAERPPTVAELAAQGTTKQGPAGTRTKHAAYGSLVRFADFCSATEPQALARAVDVKQARALRRCVELADRWLDGFVAHLP